MAAIYSNNSQLPSTKDVLSSYTYHRNNVLKKFSFLSTDGIKYYLDEISKLENFKQLKYFWYVVNKKDKVVLINDSNGGDSSRYLLDYDEFERLKSENYDFNAKQMQKNDDYWITYKASNVDYSDFDKWKQIAPILDFYLYYILEAGNTPYIILSSDENKYPKYLNLASYREVNVYKTIFVKKTGKTITEEFFDVQNNNLVADSKASFITKDPAYFNMESDFADLEYGVIVNKSAFSVVRKNSDIVIKIPHRCYNLSTYLSYITYDKLISGKYPEIKNMLEKNKIIDKVSKIKEQLNTAAVPFCMDIDYLAFGNKIEISNIKKSNFYTCASTDIEAKKCIMEIFSKPSFSTNTYVDDKNTILFETRISKDGLLYITQPNKTLEITEKGLVIKSGKCSITIKKKVDIMMILDFLLENKKIDQDECDSLKCKYLLIDKK